LFCFIDRNILPPIVEKVCRKWSMFSSRTDSITIRWRYSMHLWLLWKSDWYKLLLHWFQFHWRLGNWYKNFLIYS